MSSHLPRLPGNLSHLQRLANRAAQDARMPVGRYRRWVNAHIISAVLGRVRDEDDEPLFVLKGGAAMELRLGLTARASKDYDAVFRARAMEMLDALDQALSDDWNDFQLQRAEAERVRNTHAVRTDIKLAYKGKSWGTVRLEMSPAEGKLGNEIDRVPARSLDPVQLEGPEWIPCVSVRYQIAQKIHACTEGFADGKQNDRFRDLIDIRLLRGLVDDISTVRAACIEIFELRGTHAWPPNVTVSAAWPDGFRRMAHEVGFFTDDVEVAAKDLRRFIDEMEGRRR